MIEKIRNNIYKIINDYNETIKKKYQEEKINNINNEFKYKYTKHEQEFLDYQVSIYKNIEQKELLFLQLLDEENKNPYDLEELNAIIFRIYIGLYDNGQMQTVEQISRIINQPTMYEEELIKEKIREILKETIKQLQKPYVQQELLEERIITNKKELLNKDISYLTMTDNLEQIFRLLKINTIEDIINIKPEKIYTMNIQYGYNPDIIIFPTRIKKQIETLGLQFKEEKRVEIIENNNKIIDSNIKEHAIYLKTELDLLAAQQFEPELLNTLQEIERFKIDNMINDGYMTHQLQNVKNQILYEKLIQKYSPKTINDIIKNEYKYLADTEIDTIEKMINNIFDINNNITEEEKRVEKEYLKEKN